ncbi:MAG: aminotransferase class V-fold PLP-dependent enzyme [Rhodovarius sp.]|nr:aminotransferase class V-fold PLP-dependent enzyme [Rhodovarius sp.]
MMRKRLPERGLPWPELAAALEAAKAGDYSWRRGRVAVFIYYLDEALERVQKEAYLAYFTENALGQRAFPSLAKLEREVVEMGLSLLHAPPEAGGTFTSGGSESIFLALLAARERAGRAHPNIVLAESAHLTFDRAAWYLGMAVRRIPLAAGYVADVPAMAAATDQDTIALIASAPCYPYGTIDDIPALAALAQEKGVWLHVDACVGGFLSPFLERLGHALPPWDFRVPGVTSISADLHKHGMAAKGASLLLVADDAWRAYHRFASSAWPRGPYVSYVAQGTRPGGAVAAAWAVMHSLGEEGYLRAARRILDAKARLSAGLRAVGAFEVLEPSPHAMLVFRPRDPALDAGRIAAAMDARGWLPSRMSDGRGFHLHLNPIHDQVVEEYLAHLGESLAEATAGAGEGAAPGPAY